MFVGEACRVAPFRSAWLEDAPEAEIAAFLRARGMPPASTPADHFGFLLLAASWLEDSTGKGGSEALQTLFADYLLPWCDIFLGKLEAYASTAFWRTLAQITREAIEAMWDELTEDALSE